MHAALHLPNASEASLPIVAVMASLFGEHVLLACQKASLQAWVQRFGSGHANAETVVDAVGAAVTVSVGAGPLFVAAAVLVALVVPAGDVPSFLHAAARVVVQM